MTKIKHIDAMVTEDLHKDFRWALAVNGHTGKDVLPELVQQYVECTKALVSARYSL